MVGWISGVEILCRDSHETVPFSTGIVQDQTQHLSLVGLVSAVAIFSFAV